MKLLSLITIDRAQLQETFHIVAKAVPIFLPRHKLRLDYTVT